MKKPLILVVGLSSTIGGVEKSVLGLIDCLKESYDFQLLCFGDSEDYKNLYSGFNVHFITKRKKNIIKSNLEQKEFFKNNSNLFDYAWINMCSASNISTHKYIKKYTTTKIITHSHSSKIEVNNKLLKIIHVFLHKKNQKKLCELSDILISCSQNASTHLYGKTRKKVNILFNGINTSEFIFNEYFRDEIRNSLNIKSDSMVLCCIGRLVEVKNFIFSIKVFEKYQKINNNSFLVIAGTGNQETLLKDYVNNKDIKNVKFLGYRNDVNKILSCCDILLQPSLFEGFPVNLIEAQANGIYCLVSDNITKEVKVTDIINYLPISDESIDLWLKDIDRFYPVNRKGYNEIIKNKGFDQSNISHLFKEILK